MTANIYSYMVSNPLYNTHVVSYAVTAHPIVKHIATFHYVQLAKKVKKLV